MNTIQNYGTQNYQLKASNSKANNLQLQTNPSFGTINKQIGTKLAEEVSKVIPLAGAVTAGTVLAIQNGKTKEEEPVSCVINMNKIQTRKERLNNENLKKTFNRILTEIESRPEIIELIKRDDSAYLPDELFSTIKYERRIKLNNGETVQYTLTKFHSGYFSSKVDLLPYENHGSIDDDLVDSFSMFYDPNGKSAAGWDYETTKRRGILTNMAYNQVGDNGSIVSDTYESPAFKNITKDENIVKLAQEM